MAEIRHEYGHPKAELIATKGIIARRMVGANSEAKLLRQEIQGRTFDIQLIELYLPTMDDETKARAERTIRYLQQEIDSMAYDLQYASERRVQ